MAWTAANDDRGRRPRLSSTYGGRRGGSRRLSPPPRRTLDSVFFLLFFLHISHVAAVAPPHRRTVQGRASIDKRITRERTAQTPLPPPGGPTLSSQPLKHRRIAFSGVAPGNECEHRVRTSPEPKLVNSRLEGPLRATPLPPLCSPSTTLSQHVLFINTRAAQKLSLASPTSHLVSPIVSSRAAVATSPTRPRHVSDVRRLFQRSPFVHMYYDDACRVRQREERCLSAALSFFSRVAARCSLPQGHQGSRRRCP